MDDLAIYEALIRAAREGAAAVLATVVETAGSAPRKAGAKMLVRADGTIHGTVGGGRVESGTIDAARAMMGGGAPRTLRFTLTEAHGFACGGSLTVYLEPVVTPPRLLVFGGGHVGQARAKAAAFAGFRVTVADERPAFASEALHPDADETIVGDAPAVLAQRPADEGTFIVVATTDHGRDFDAVRAALATKAGYIGVVGSRRKREALLRTLSGEGVPEAQLGRVVMPVGLPIGAETPAEIAVSIVAQLVEARRSGAARGAGDRSGGGRVESDGAVQAAPAAG
jgi:xanthine dehydrogenase accessory factor